MTSPRSPVRRVWPIVLVYVALFLIGFGCCFLLAQCTVGAN